MELTGVWNMSKLSKKLCNTLKGPIQTRLEEFLGFPGKTKIKAYTYLTFVVWCQIVDRKAVAPSSRGLRECRILHNLLIPNVIKLSDNIIKLIIKLSNYNGVVRLQN